MILEDFWLIYFFTTPPLVHRYFYPSTMGFTHPNDGSLHKAMPRIKLWKLEQCRLNEITQCPTWQHNILAQVLPPDVTMPLSHYTQQYHV